MATIRLVPSIQQNIVADFLLGASSSTLTSKNKITMREIYAILQNLFRSVTVSRTQQSPLFGAHGIGVDDLSSVDLTRALHDLRDGIINEMNEILNEQNSQCLNNVDNQMSNQTIRVIQRRNM
jgi:hypothetical protein